MPLKKILHWEIGGLTILMILENVDKNKDNDCLARN